MKLKLIVNPNPPEPTPNLSQPMSGDAQDSYAAVDRLEAFLKADFCVPTLLKALQESKEHPIEAVFLIRWTHELEELKARWLGNLDGLRASLNSSITHNGER